MTRYLFYLLVASFSLGVLGRVTILPSVTVSIQDILVLCILLLSIPALLVEVSKKSGALRTYAVFAVISVLGVFIYTKGVFEFFASASYLFRLTSYLLLVIPLMSLPKDTLKKIKIEMICVGFIIVLLGYVQYVFYPNLRNLFYLGWDEHLYRLFSTFLDPNFAGMYLTLVALLYSSLFFELFKKGSAVRKLVLSAGYAFLVPSLFLTYSRSAFLSAFIAFVVFFILIKQKKTVVLFLLLFLGGILMIPKELGGEGVKLLRTASIIARLDTYQNALKIFFDNPIIGVGFDSLRFVSRNYGFVSGKDVLSSHAAAGVPNSFLVLLATTGLAGFALFIVFMKDVILKIIQIRRYNTLSIYASSVLSSFVAVLVGSLFENFLFYAPIMLWMVISVGVLMGQSRKLKGGR